MVDEKRNDLVFIGTKGGELANRIEVTIADVKKFLAPKASDQELYMFVQIARSQGLNPFKREIYFVPFRDKQSGELRHSIVVGYEVYLKRALASGLCEGFKTEFLDRGTDEERARVTIYRKGWKEPFIWEVKRSVVDKKQSIWNVLPEHMTIKTALSQGFRLVFADAIDGLPYTGEEIEAGGLEVQAEFTAQDETPKKETGSISLDDLKPSEEKKGMTGDELVQKLQDAEPVEREAGDDSIDWHKYLDMPAERYSPDEITGLCNLLDYPLAGNDPVGIKALINGKTKYYKLAVERLQKWTKGEFK